MSHYACVKTKFKDVEALVQALTEVKTRIGMWTKEMIEVHDKPVNLHGYQGDVRAQKAEIVIRRSYVGGASNDIGFVKGEDGTYNAIISEYDESFYGKDWRSDVAKRYGVNVIKNQARYRGWQYQETEGPNNTVEVTVRRW